MVRTIGKRMSLVTTVILLLMVLLGSSHIAHASEGQAVRVPNGTYNIVPVFGRSDYALDIRDNSKANGSVTQLWKKTNTLNQRFIIENTGYGWFTIKAKHSGKYLDVDNGNKNNGAKIQQWAYNGGDNQLWRAYDAGGYGAFIYLAARSGANAGQVMDVSKGNYKSGATVYGWKYSKVGNQMWMLVPANPYKIVSGVYRDSQSYSKVFNYRDTKKIRVRCYGQFRKNSVGTAPGVKYTIYNTKTGKVLKSKIIHKNNGDGKKYVKGSIYTIPKGYSVKIKVKPYTTTGGFSFIEGI